MKLYCGIDLHSTNHYVVVIDEDDKRLYQKRLPNELDKTLQVLERYKADLQGIAVESTFNYPAVSGVLICVEKTAKAGRITSIENNG